MTAFARDARINVAAGFKENLFDRCRPGPHGRAFFQYPMPHSPVIAQGFHGYPQNRRQDAS